MKLSQTNRALNSLKNWRFWLAIISFQLILVSIHASFGYQYAESQGKLEVFTLERFFWLVVMYLPMACVGPFVVVLAMVFEFNKEKWLPFILVHVVIMLPVVTSMQLANAYFAGKYYNFDLFTGSLFDVIVDYYQHVPWQTDYIYYFALTAIGFSLKYYWRIQQKEKENLALTKQLVEKELKALKMQLNPHFLFNTLNSAVGLIRTDDKDSAVMALTELSAMLRTVLENNQTQLVSLKKEIDLVESYLKIQQMRFSDKLQVDVFVEQGALHYRVPFFLIQPLIENAINHGSQNNGVHNYICLDVTARDDKLSILVSNDFVPDAVQRGLGMGLSLIKQTLEQTYKGRAKITTHTLIESEQNKFLVEIEIPLQEH